MSKMCVLNYTQCFIGRYYFLFLSYKSKTLFLKLQNSFDTLIPLFVFFVSLWYEYQFL